VVDNDGETGTDTIQVTVNNVAPIVDAGANQTIDEGSVLNLAPATFNDKGTLDTHTATINWGDGSPSEAGTVSESPYGPPGSPTGSSGTVSGSHVYTNDGSFTLTVCVNDDDGSTSCDPLTAIINNSPPTADEISITTIEDTSVGVTLTGSDPGDDDLTFGIDNGPSFGSLFGTSPNLTYTPYPDFYGEDSFSYHADDSLSVSEGATVVITVNSVNDPPVCSDDSATTDEDTAVMIPVTSNDTGGPSNEDQALTVDTVTQATHGVVINNNDGTVTYSPHSNFNFNGSDSFKYVVSDNEGLSEEANVDVTVNPINDPPTLTANLQSQTVQYSDTIVPVSITASDIDSSLINLSTPDLPNSLSLSFEQCVDIAEVKSCEWILDGQVLVGAGTYDITIYANDGENENDTDVSITVEQEDADVNFDGDNPVGLQVASPGGNSGLFELTAAVFETLPDLANGEPYPGDIGLADVTMILQPVGPGSSVNGICTSNVELNGGYDDLNIVTCTFENVEVNTYTLEVNIAGDYYTGSDEDVLVVYDPSLGFTTGGGWFYWPGTDDPGIGYLGDRTNFGYTMKYNKKGSKVQGSLLMISRLPNKTHYRIKSNALYGLALGETSVDDNVCGWASFSGKSTYLEPGWLEPEGNHEFLTYVEDCNEPGTGVDRFWIEIHDRDGNVIDVISMPVEAYDNAKTIRGGNIVVPHNSK
jgi:hypothetical protein